MGLFGILKKKEKKAPREYDLPPLPPIDELAPPKKQGEDLISHDRSLPVPTEKQPEAPLFPSMHEEEPTPAPAEEHEDEYTVVTTPKPKVVKLSKPPAPEPAAPMADVPDELPDFPLSKPKDDEHIEVMAPEPEAEPIHPIINKPVFVSVSYYKKVLGDLSSIDTDCESCEQILKRVDNIRGQQDSQLNAWRSSMEDLQRKFLFIDKTLFEKKH